ncbi:MAG: class I SAM-dependent methyltransferase [Candidatus Omnitrophica bacterium]|nr:class I SAM-dependent methyltransferase [Candidatus Omnitrophota bacterium]
MINVARTHDKAIYLADEYYERPKEVFKVAYAQAQASGALMPGAQVGDFGCAAGQFLAYLKRQVPDAHYTGYDVVPELLAQARRKVPGVTFREGSVLDRALLPEASLDIAFLLGVHSIFDAFEPCLSNLLFWTKPGGRVYVFGGFNPHPIDVWVKYRLVDDPDPEHREPGWNLFSKASFSRYLDVHVGPERHTFIPFELPFDLPPRADDPVRTWTMRDAEQRRLLTNGLCLVMRFELLEIRR